MKQLALDDASAQWADVLARLRGSVLSVPRTTPAGWRLVEAYSAHAPCVPRRDARAGLYRCQRMTREVQEATGLNPNTVQSWFRKRWDIDQAFAAYLARRKAKP